MAQLHQELREYHGRIEVYQKSGWTLWSAMKRVLLVVLEQRDTALARVKELEEELDDLTLEWKERG